MRQLADDLVVDRRDDVVAVVLKPQHRLGQKVTGDGLGDVLGQLPAVGLDLAPSPAEPTVGGPVGQPAGFDARVEVGKPPPARQLGEQEVAFALERDRASGEGVALLADRVRRGFLQPVPEADDLRVRLAPLHLDGVGGFVLDGDAVRLGHRLKRADTAAVAQRENGHLADLALVLVLRRDGAAVDPRGRVAVDVAAIAEHIERPLLVSEPRQHAGFDGAEVGHQQAVAFVGHDHPAQAGRQRRHRVAVQRLQQASVPVAEQFDAVVGVAERRPGEVLRLEAAASPAPGLGAVIPEQAAGAVAFAGQVQHRQVLRRAGLTQRLPDPQHLGHRGRQLGVSQRGQHGALVVSLQRVAVALRPRHDAGA